MSMESSGGQKPDRKGYDRWEMRHQEYQEVWELRGERRLGQQWRESWDRGGVFFVFVYD